MNDNLFRALTIGAGIIMILGTMSFVVMYYFTAVRAADGLGGNEDIYSSAEEIFYGEIENMKSSNSGVVTGTEARNIIFKFTGNLDNIIVDLYGNSGSICEKINQLRDPLTGQQDFIRINNIINPTDTVKIEEATLEDNKVYIKLLKMN